MGIIKAAKLAFDYLRYEEEGEEPEVNRAIDHVDLDIEEGKFIAILGHNGSGKSTLAKHINGLLVPTEELCGWIIWIPLRMQISGISVRRPAWFFRIRIIRSSAQL